VLYTGPKQRKRREEKSSQKIQKSWKSLLTLRAGPDYIRLINDGGSPRAAKKFASEAAKLNEITESRVSDTLPGPEPKANRPTTTRLRCLFFEN